MYAIKDLHSAGRVMVWVRQPPLWLDKTQYVYVDDELYRELEHKTVWFGDDGSYTTEKPYTYKYHYLDNGRWRLDHAKVAEHIAEMKVRFNRNIDVYEHMGLDANTVQYLRSQVAAIATLDDVEEFTQIKLGGPYEAVYNHRYHVAI